MVIEIGALRFATIGVEATYGGGMTGSGTCVPFTDIDIHERWDKQRPAWFINWPKRALEYPRRRWVEGSMSFPLYDEYVQNVLDWACERDAIADGFNLANSFAVKEVDVNYARHFKGLLASRLTITGSNDEPEIMCTLDVMGREVEDIAKFARPALPVGLPFLFNGATVEFYSVDVSALCTSFEITIENNLLLGEGPLDCNYRPYKVIGGFEYVSLNVTMLYDSITNRTRLRNQTEGSFVVTFGNGGCSPSTEVELEIPKFTLDEVPEDLEAEGASQENIPITAVADSSGDQILYTIT